MTGGKKKTLSTEHGSRVLRRRSHCRRPAQQCRPNCASTQASASASPTLETLHVPVKHIIRAHLDIARPIPLVEHVLAIRPRHDRASAISRPAPQIERPALVLGDVPYRALVGPPMVRVVIGDNGLPHRRVVAAEELRVPAHAVDIDRARAIYQLVALPGIVVRQRDDDVIRAVRFF